jgi:N-methylhydantoinase B/oxoprolinase/acetone carboxylase alpha subunit
MESLYPIFIDKAEFIPDSGGAGKRRGGVAFSIYYHPLQPVTFFSMIEKAETPRWGIGEGKEGLRNNLFINRKEKGESRILKTSGIDLTDKMVLRASPAEAAGLEILWKESLNWCETMS